MPAVLDRPTLKLPPADVPRHFRDLQLAMVPTAKDLDLQPAVYLAARYGRREEICHYKASLEHRGFRCTARWLAGPDQIGPDGKPLGPIGERMCNDQHSPGCGRIRKHIALQCRQDIEESDVVFVFTEAETIGFTTGGRHVELGMALALGKPVYRIGPNENVFCDDAQVNFFYRFEDGLRELCRLFGG